MKKAVPARSATERPRSRTFASVPLAAMAAVSLVWLVAAAAQDVADGTLAAAIRESGHPCVHVISKERVSASVWRVRCNSGSFQVTVKDGSTSQVTPVD